MRRWRTWLIVFSAVLMTSSALPAAGEVKLGSAAPDVTGGPWINSGALNMAGLRGRVALVEFWTYG